MKSCRSTNLALVLSTVVAVALAGCGGKAVVPSSYKSYNAKNGAFKIEYPDGWTAEGGGNAQYASAKFTSGKAQIEVYTGLSGSAMGDIAASQNRMSGAKDDDETLAPVAKVHQVEQAGFVEEQGAKEQPPVALKTGLGDTRKSEFTASGSFGGAMHGYRATALSRDFRIRIVCQCPEAEWAALKPAFDRIITSVSMGTPEM